MAKDLFNRLFRHGIPLILTLAIVGVLARSWFSYQTTTGAVNQAEAAYEARSDVMTILTDLLDQETGLRGYVSTRQRFFLAPYTASRWHILANLHLAIQAAANANLSFIDPSIVDTETTYHEWYDGVALPLIADPRRWDAVKLQGRGKLLMDRMRADVDSAVDILDAKSASYSKQTQDQLALGAIVSVII